MSESSSGSGVTYRAFISYSHRDKVWGDWLHKALETYRVPSRLVGKETAAGIIPRRLHPIFRDREELASATDLGRKVNQALAQSETLIVICSPAAAASRWVNEEVLAFKRMGRGERVFCLIVDGEPNATDLPGREAEECFCPALRFQLDSNGQPANERTEPIAADARPGKDGKANAKLKLVAGMLDVGFDALKQREQHRRMRRMTAITALALVVMAVTVVLAVFALVSRHDAVIAQQKAVVAQQAAERRQKQAEGLVGFMLGDLNDKLNQVHRLDIMQAVDDKAMAYFQSLPAADATDSALAMRVTALEKIGNVRMDQGRIPPALKAYQAASALAAELVRRAPGDANRQAAYADSLKWVGQAYWYQGDLAHALRNFQAAAKLLQKTVAAKPNDTEFAFKLAAAQSDAGHVLETRGDFSQAQREYRGALNLYQTLVARDPSNPKWEAFLSNDWDNLGKLALERGNFEAAVIAYRTSQRMQYTLSARDPMDHDAQEFLLRINAILGRTLGLCGEIDAGLRYTKEAMDSAQALLSFDATNTDWQDLYGLYSQQMGSLLREDGQLKKASVVDAKALHDLSTLVAKNPTHAYYQQDLSEAQLESARLQLEIGKNAAAETQALLALTLIHTLHSKSPNDRSILLLAAQTHLLLGRIAARRKNTNIAGREWTKARDMLQPALKAGDDPNFLAAYAAALLQLTHKSEI